MTTMDRFTIPQAFPGDVFDLDKVNAAMDAIFDHSGDENAGRYALVHTHGWAATDAVTYARAAMFFIHAGIDPNRPQELEGLAEPAPAPGE